MEQLKAIFPEHDHEVLKSVLDSNDGNVEVTTNQLLEMSNPTTPAAYIHTVNVFEHFP